MNMRINIEINILNFCLLIIPTYQKFRSNVYLFEFLFELTLACHSYKLKNACLEFINKYYEKQKTNPKPKNVRPFS